MLDVLKTKLTWAIVAVLTLLALSVPSVVMAQGSDDICKGVALTGTNCDPNSNAAESAIGNIVETVINLISLAVGVIAVIMVIVGGLKYIMSNGDSNNVNSAKNTILYAVVGLVIVATAQIIVRFVLGKF